MKYSDLRSGGVTLGNALQHYRRAENSVVLGIIRGGVTVAFEVAQALDLPLDLVLVRPMLQRLPVGTICACRVAGTLVLDEELAVMTAHPPQTVEEVFVAATLEDLAQREQSCRGGRPSVSIAGQTVLLIDNGLRTGSTMRSAIRAVGHLRAARIVVAVPVGSGEGVAVVTPLADEVLCLSSPEPFGHVGMWYRRFDVSSEPEIRSILDGCLVENDSPRQ